MKGFALILSLLLLLLLTVLALTILMTAGNHYSAVGSLFENQNARIACDSALKEILNRNNYDSGSPRYWLNPGNWQAQELSQFFWNEYTIQGRLEESWNDRANNWFHLSAQKGAFSARQMVQLRQVRIEDFALFTDQEQVLPYSSLIEGMAFSRPSLHLNVPGVRFRGPVFSSVLPLEHATYLETVSQRWQFPLLADTISMERFREDAVQNGLFISDQNPVFWTGTHYTLLLDLLRMDRSAYGWSLTYDGLDLGEVRSLHIFFDRDVRISQEDSSLAFASGKPREPLHISSALRIEIASSLAPLPSKDAEHPLCLISGGTVRIGKEVPKACRISAGIIALGSEYAGGMQVSMTIEEGEESLTQEKKDSYIQEIYDSTFLLEEQKKSQFVAAVDAGERAVWFRGTVALASIFVASETISQLHFEKSAGNYPLLPSLPFLIAVEGSRQWL